MSHRALSSIQFREVGPDEPYDGGASYTHPHERAIEALEHGDRDLPVGHLRFHKDTGRVEGTEVYPAFRRQGVATAMWHEAHARGYELHHSDERTDAGDAWARKVGGPVPPLRRRIE